MSAREELYAYGMSGKMHSPDNSERMSAHIDAYRDEVAHDLAERLRACKSTAQLVGLDTAGLLAAAALIDPEATDA